MKTPEQWAALLTSIPRDSSNFSATFLRYIAQAQAEAYVAGQEAMRTEAAGILVEYDEPDAALIVGALPIQPMPTESE